MLWEVMTLAQVYFSTYSNHALVYHFQSIFSYREDPHPNTSTESKWSNGEDDPQRGWVDDP